MKRIANESARTNRTRHAAVAGNRVSVLADVDSGGKSLRAVNRDRSDDRSETGRAKLHAAVYSRTSREFKNVERISTAQQVEDGKRTSVELGCAEPAIYIDENLSGKLPPVQFADFKKPGAGKRQSRAAKQVRPALSQLLDEVAAGRINCIICRKRDRLFRSTILALRFYEYLRQHKCRLVCTNENLPAGTDASGLFTLTVLAAAAQLELDKTSENICAAKAYSRRNGLKMGPVWTPGYRDGKSADGKKGIVVIHEPTRDMVREVFKRWNSDESVGDICRWLNSTHRDKCKPRATAHGKASWHPVSVWRMLRNRRYIGLNEDGTTSQHYTRIIDPLVFGDAGKRLKGRIGTKQRRESPTHALAGLLRCGDPNCGKPLRLVNMSATNRDLKLYACGNTEIVHAEKPFVMRESEWLNFLVTFFVSVDEDRWDGRQNDPEIALAKSKLEALDDEVKRLADLLSDRELPATAYATATTAIERQRKKLAEQIANITPKSIPTVNARRSQWDTLEPHERQQLLRETIDRVEVKADRAIIYRHPGGWGEHLKITAPLMKRRSFGTRAVNCLMPKAYEQWQATKFDATKALMMLNEPTLDWRRHVSEDFYPAIETQKRLVSRRARKKHGLKGGKNYPTHKR